MPDSPVRILAGPEREALLQRLRNLLHGLPKNIPEGCKYYNFKDFSPSQDKVEDFGAAGALNNELEVVFCPLGRQKGPVVLKERGAGLEAIVDVLRRFTAEFPTDAVLQKWIFDLIDAAEHAGTVGVSSLLSTCY